MKALKVVLTLAFLTSCSQNSEWAEVTFTYNPPGLGQTQLMSSLEPASLTPTAPIWPSDFRCLAVNVVGQGIAPSTDSTDDELARIPGLLNGSSCSYPGIISKRFSPTAASTTLNLAVLKGPSRIFQVVGVQDDPNVTLSFCGDGPLPVCTNATCIEPRVYELGRAIRDINGAAIISIDNTYKNLTTTQQASRVVNCEGQFNKNYLYVGSQVGEDIVGYTQNIDGSLANPVSNPLGAGATPLSLITTTSGNNLFTLLDNGGTKFIYPFIITSTGTLTSTASGKIVSAASSRLAIDSIHRCLIYHSTGSIYSLPYTAAGTFGTETSQTLSSIESIAVNEATHTLFVGHHTSPDRFIKRYAISSSCTLTAIANGSFDAQSDNPVTNLLVNPNGTKIISGDSGAFDIAIIPAPNNAAAWSGSINIGMKDMIFDLQNKFVVGATAATPFELKSYELADFTNANNASGSDAAIGLGVDPSGNYAYVTTASDVIYGFHINRTTGALTALPASTTPPNGGLTKPVVVRKIQ